VRMFFKGNDEHGYFYADTSMQWMGIRSWVGVCWVRTICLHENDIPVSYIRYPCHMVLFVEVDGVNYGSSIYSVQQLKTAITLYNLIKSRGRYIGRLCL